MKFLSADLVRNSDSASAFAGGAGSGAPNFEKFGDGSDGTVTIASGTTTLTRDMYYANLTISGTGKLVTNGWRVFVSGTLDLTAAPAGAISWDGSNGNAAVGATAGANSSAPTSNACGIGTGSFAGVAGTTAAGSVGSNANGNPMSNAGGGPGSAAGKGGASSGGVAGGAGGNAGTVTATTARYYAPFLNTGQGGLIGGGAGGAAGGGGGGATSNSGGGSGSGGSGGNVLYLAANTISVTGAATGAISCKGGNGGNGGAGAGSGGGGGGGAGAGGGGGYIYVVFQTIIGSHATIIDASGGTGGTGGAGAGSGKGGQGGAGGAGGRAFKLNLGSATLSDTNGIATVPALPAQPSTSAGSAGTAGTVMQVALP